MTNSGLDSRLGVMVIMAMSKNKILGFFRKRLYSLNV